MLPKHLPARPVLPILTEQSRVGLPPCATTAYCGHAAGQVPSVQSGWQSPVNVSGSWLRKVIVDDLGWNCCIAAMVTLRKKITNLQQNIRKHKIWDTRDKSDENLKVVCISNPSGLPQPFRYWWIYYTDFPVWCTVHSDMLSKLSTLLASCSLDTCNPCIVATYLYNVLLSRTLAANGTLRSEVRLIHPSETSCSIMVHIHRTSTSPAFEIHSTGHKICTSKRTTAS